MDEAGNPLDLLAWSTHAVNQVRAVLSAINVTMPAVLAQLLSVLVLSAVGWYLLAPARAPDRSVARLGSRVALAAAGLGIISILAGWADNLLAPRSQQIIGTVTPAGVNGLEIDLLDFEEQSMGAPTDADSHGAFVVSYEPAFADPPKALQVSARGCDSRRLPLRRSHLLGSPVQVQLKCGDIR